MIRGRLNPIIAHEMYTRMRGWRAFVVLTLFVLLLSCIAATIYAQIYTSEIVGSNVGVGGIQSAPTTGKAIFAGIILFLVALISLIAPGYTAGAIAGEWERKTYEVLLVTPLHPTQIVLGKIGGVLGFLLLLILASLPIQSIALLFGGVEPVEMLIAALGLLVTTLVFSALGLYVSTLVRSTLAAQVMAFILSIVLVYGFLFVVVYLSATLGSAAGPSLTPGGRSPLLSLVLVYGFGFLLSINPIGTIILTGLLVADGKSYFFFSQQIGSATLWFVSPWLIYVTFHTLLAIILIRLTARRIARVSDR